MIALSEQGTVKESSGLGNGGHNLIDCLFAFLSSHPAGRRCGNELLTHENFLVLSLGRPSSWPRQFGFSPKKNGRIKLLPVLMMQCVFDKKKHAVL